MQYVSATAFILSGFMGQRKTCVMPFLDSSENLIGQRHQGPAVRLVFLFLPQIGFLTSP